MNWKWAEKVSNNSLLEVTKQLPVKRNEKEKMEADFGTTTSNRHHLTSVNMNPQGKRTAQKHLAE